MSNHIKRKRLSKNTVRSFQEDVYRFYQRHRRMFPWRLTNDPYQILVSEVMLQQTQADRVRSYFKRFVRRFPSIFSLARASVGDVLRVWHGLGYNRRALNLKRAAEALVSRHRGVIPCNVYDLENLPGVGMYTARAILAFAFNKPVAFIETNIRTVFLHHFFKSGRKVLDREILPLVKETIDERSPHAWYQALMDYGVMLKQSRRNENGKSRHYIKQQAFRGSRRELRGKLLTLALAGPVTSARLMAFCARQEIQKEKAEPILDALVFEGFLKKNRYSRSLR